MARKKKKLNLSDTGGKPAKEYNWIFGFYQDYKDYYFDKNDNNTYYSDRDLAAMGLKAIKCKNCGTVFTVKRRNNKTVLCPDCAAEQKRQKDRERKRRQRERTEMEENMSYWEQRVHHDLEISRQKLVLGTERELVWTYKFAQEDLEKEITTVLSKIADAKAKGEQVLVNDLYREKRYVELFQHLNDKITEVWDDWGSELSSTIIESYEEAKRIIDENSDSVRGTPVDALLSNVRAVDARQVVNQTWSLDGKKFSDRIWANKSKMIDRLKKALADCLVQGKSPYASAKEMCKVLDVGLRDCYRLVRTETAHAQVMAQTEKYKEYGFTHGKFLASKSCCDECQRHDGEVHTLDEFERMLPVHPNCTCTYTLVGGD